MIKPKAIIFDIDHTLLFPSDKPYKEHTVEGNTPLIALVSSLWRNTWNPTEVILLTGRHERLRKITEQECIANNIFYDELIMNSTNNPIQQGHISKAIDIQPILEKYEIMAIIDDDEKCCEMYKLMGLPILRVL